MPLYVNDGDDGFIVYESHCDGNVDDDVNAVSYTHLTLPTNREV